MNLIAAQRKIRLGQLAQAAGFDWCGVAESRRLHEEAKRLEQWLSEGRHGEMAYMERYFEQRLDPSLLLPGCKSVVVLIHNYFPGPGPAPHPKIARYARGEDYHQVLKDKMRWMVHRMQEEFGNFQMRIFTDSAPLLEKAWARLAGAGWIGKNTNLLQKEKGSYFFLSEILCDLEIAADQPVQDHCGDCTRCLDACPTQALEPYRLDASKCISYLTIELRSRIPEQFSNQMEGWVFGCDICQEVCPWNRFAKPHSEPRLLPKDEVWPSARERPEMSEDIFKERFGHSPITRTGLAGMQRNIRFL